MEGQKEENYFITWSMARRDPAPITAKAARPLRESLESHGKEADIIRLPYRNRPVN